MRPLPGTGFALLIVSRNTSPGSPPACAALQMASNSSAAGIRATILPVRGLTSRCRPLRSTARRNASVTPTDRLKCGSSLGDSALAVTKSQISGCDTSSTAIQAPRRRPPMETTPAALSYSRRNDTGPLAVPPVEATRSPAGRRWLNAYPVPPPARCSSAACPSVAKIDCSESSIGRTKQPASSPRSVPEFINVGEFGRNSRLRNSVANRSAHRLDEPGSYWSSAAATQRADRSISSPVDSAGRPCSSCSR
ncbi:Uncharacterised protein [Mycobacterium tuberculosis]|uniref:Uncharacterized protein n=2 Tax=Mycobacterium tuberculosis TaxID=1773 RepID=A0A0U0S1E3_MYCTX|nr:Uncharacterised protein [Mycobacterium tuberculosis]CKP42068.1 Uncharacterised protein [Mycobacterium tuberculosis]CKQ11239.1 Uncharacterised protein [Mycobacterium tuberculosis]CKR95297.1 Uncharacterised protein [Mycobacterium tuberculosis]CKT08261.1 Uncharacterised protein [Mycobacterium tuberculosis]